MSHRTRRRLGRTLLIATTLWAGVLTLGQSIGPASRTAGVAHAAAGGLHVQGNKLVNASNQPVILRGANRSGTEYACLNGPNFSDGPTDAASVQAMAGWGLNTVRVPLNEDCWLGINGSAIGGAVYQQDIKTWVDTLTQNGMYVILDLHWSAPGSAKAVSQQPMADQDHSPAFWSGVAGAFASYPNVIFDLFNEPFPDNHSFSAAAWQCVRDGGACSGVPYVAAGMQELVNTVRSTGAGNVIIVGGANYSSSPSDPALGSSVSQWINYLPNDPLHNLVESWHAYNNSACSNLACWQGMVAPVAAQYPIVVGEFGDTNCTSQYTTSLLPWLDSVGISYVGWNWGTDFQCQSLVTNYSGSPSQPYGQAYKDHLAALSLAVTQPFIATASPVPPTVAIALAASTSVPPTIAIALATSTSVPPTLAPATSTPVPPTVAPATTVPSATPAPSTAQVGLTITTPLQLSAAAVTVGGTLTGVVTVQNTGSAALTLQNVVIAARPPNGTNAGGPFMDFGGIGAIRLVPGQSITIQKSRTFSSADPLGTWYSYVTYQTADSIWHDSPVDTRFTVSAATVAKSTALPSSTPIPPTTTATRIPATATSIPATSTPSTTSSSALSLASLVNNLGISSDSNPAAGNFDSLGYSYSAQTLTTAGMTSGKVTNLNGIPFLWTSAASGSVDNVTLRGQTIVLPSQTRRAALRFLGAASGASQLTGTLTYSDGATQSYQLGFSDWTLNAGKSQPSFGNQIAITLPYRDNKHGWRDNHSTYLFTASVALNPNKTLVKITLPNSTNSGGVHVFAITVT